MLPNRISRFFSQPVIRIVLAFFPVVSIAANAISQCADNASSQLQGIPGSSLLQVQHGSGRHSRKACIDERGKRYMCFEQQVPEQELQKDGVLVVIPGLGSEERAILVEQNIRWLKTQAVPFECWIFVYRSEVEFPLNESRFEPCLVKRHPGFWLSHVLALPLNETRMPWILHMMDSITPREVDLKKMFAIMRANKLGHASPTFFEDHQTTWHTVWPSMNHEEGHRVGRLVDFIELHFNMFSRQYFACLQDKIDANNTLGWGLDQLLPAFCGGAVTGSEVEAGSMGLLDRMGMMKKYWGSYNRGQAGAGHDKFLDDHPNTSMPSYVSLGELTPPIDATVAAA